jgi:DNA polymerase-1
MVRINEAMEKQELHSSMILQVHDELNFDVLPGEIEQVRRIVKYEMENVARLKVPLTIELGVGSNWLEAH